MKTRLRKILTAAGLCLLLAGGGGIFSSQRAEALPGGGGGGGGGSGGDCVHCSCIGSQLSGARSCRCPDGGFASGCIIKRTGNWFVGYKDTCAEQLGPCDSRGFGGGLLGG